MTLVVDASTVADLVLATRRSLEIRSAIGEHLLLAPDLLVPEVLSVLRRWVLRGDLSVGRAEAAITDALDLGVRLVSTVGLARRAWALHPSITSYDAMYVALAEAASATLLTSDARLAAAASGIVDVVVPQLR